MTLTVSQERTKKITFIVFVINLVISISRFTTSLIPNPKCLALRNVFGRRVLLPTVLLHDVLTVRYLQRSNSFSKPRVFGGQGRMDF